MCALAVVILTSRISMVMLKRDPPPSKRPSQLNFVFKSNTHIVAK